MGRRRRAAVIETLHDVATTIQTEETVAGVCERTVAAAADLLDFKRSRRPRTPSTTATSNWRSC